LEKLREGRGEEMSTQELWENLREERGEEMSKHELLENLREERGGEMSKQELWEKLHAERGEHDLENSNACSRYLRQGKETPWRCWPGMQRSLSYGLGFQVC
jgi:hypothetical protein